MLLIDSNILIYAYDPASRHHERARTWLEGVLSDDEPIRFGLVSLLSFVRILSDPRLFAHPMDVAEAHAHVQTWLDRDIAAIAEPTPAHWSTFLAVATDGQARGPMLMDAHLAALAIEHGATVCTADRDFRRFKGVRVVDPLAERSG